METIIVDSRESIVDCLDTLTDLPTIPPALYIDLEGDNLSRHGTLSLLQIFVQPQNCAYLVDVYTLGKTAFLTAGSNGNTLKSILESNEITKVFFDVRNDSDALYSHFQVKLAGIHDLQLMELATRSFNRRCVNGLSKCIENDSTISFNERRIWKANKDNGHKLFDPKQGGSYAVFNKRPLSEDIKTYCVQDVSFLPDLWRNYYLKLNQGLWTVVLKATEDRVVLSHSALFNGKGRHMALGPWNAEDENLWRRFDQTRLVLAAEKTLNLSGKAPRDDKEKLNGVMPACENNSLPKDDLSKALVQGLQAIHISSSSRVNTADFHDFEDDFDAHFSSDGYNPFSGRSVSNSPVDYTACSSDDCGYCGHCPY